MAQLRTSLAAILVTGVSSVALTGCFARRLAPSSWASYEGPGPNLYSDSDALAFRQRLQSMGRDYLGEAKRTMESLGLSGYPVEELETLLK